MRAVLACVLLLTACGHEALGVGSDSRFVGLWVIDQPHHATYERTLYDFRSDGTLAVVETEWLGSGCRYSGRECVTGFVMDEAGLYCEFAERWRADNDTLVIESRCSDGTTREVALTFSADRSQNAIGTAPVEISVDGDGSFHHDHFEWRFLRCDKGTTEYACTGWP